MVATALSRASFGTEAPAVSVEVHIGSGLSALSIVGLPEAAVRESKDRVRSAISTANFDFPEGRITVNLAPADLPKEGGRYDLPIALGILAASEQIPADLLEGCEYFGELSLTGTLKPVHGVFPAVCQAAKEQHRVVVPQENLAEACLVADARVAGAQHLLDVCHHLRGSKLLPFVLCENSPVGSAPIAYPDMREVRDQAHARRALEIAAAGAHSILFIGPPGTGKSMLAHRLPGILPSMTPQEAMETAAIASVSARGFRVSEWARRPFRAPHHTAPTIALTGGGAHPKPGEISLAHHGVLFLDELPEFDRQVLEALREPLETGTICVSRIARQTDFPARFQLVAAMNPCPCGYLGVAGRRCRCSEPRMQRYRARLSSPLLDRLDLHVRVDRVEPARLNPLDMPSEASTEIAARVRLARERQLDRQGCCNAHLDTGGVERHCIPTTEGLAIIEQAVRRFQLSARAYHRLLRLARTIADLDGSTTASGLHVSEAVMFRQFDRPAGLEREGRGRSYGRSSAEDTAVAEGRGSLRWRTPRKRRR